MWVVGVDCDILDRGVRKGESAEGLWITTGHFVVDHELDMIHLMVHHIL